VRLDRGEKKSVKLGIGIRESCCLSPILSHLELLRGSDISKYDDK
jgi:hypothetical protein